MKILHFNTFPHGGAGTAARRLHQRLTERGVDSQFNYWIDQNGQQLDPSYRQMQFDSPGRIPLLRPVTDRLDRRRRRTICRHYDRHVAPRPDIFELFSIPWTLGKTPCRPDQLGCDIVHLHWLAFFIDWPSFFQAIPDSMPIVWSFHDMNPLTGGCHYSNGCERFRTGCGHCPQIAEPTGHDVSWHAIRVKNRSLRHKNIHIVTPNCWLSDLARQSPVFPANTRYHQIPLGLDEDLFHPVDKRLARQQLGLDPDRYYLAFGAEDIENWRKGFHHLLSALRRVHRQNERLECIVFGNGKLPDDRTGLPRFHEFGFVNQPQRQRLIYSAADLFVLPSREDNQPQTGLEAMACETPVVAFRAGGVPEYVRDRETGLTADVGDEPAMADRIVELAENTALRNQLAKNGRRAILKNHTAEIQARAYMDLYGKIIYQSLPPELRGDQVAVADLVK